MSLLKLVLLNGLIIGLTFAKTYEIVEPDLLSEIESKKYEFIQQFAKMSSKMEERFYSILGASLPPAKNNYIYYVNPTVTLKKDIPKVNKKGEIVGILYKKGTKINPLEHISVKPPPMIIFNACDDREVFIVKRLIKEKRLINYFLVSGGCSIKQIKDRKVYENLKSRIYLLTDELVKKLNLKNTVSFVDVDLNRKRIKVEVYKKDIN